MRRTDQLHTPEVRAKVAAAARSRARPLAERLWAKVDKNGPLFEGTPCYLWTGSKIAGHGELWVGPNHKPSKDLTHRIAWRLAGGETPPGMDIDHRCRNKACCNVLHLRLVTEYVNATENNNSPLAINAQKTHCLRGHPLSGENLAIWTPNKKTSLRGKIIPGRPERICLTCWPRRWMYAVIERETPPGCKVKWRGPKLAPDKEES